MSNKEKKDILGQEIDETELASVSGGRSQGPGGCTRDYYNRKCDATVEKGSWCHKHDWCSIWSEKYDYAPGDYGRDDAYNGV